MGGQRRGIAVQRAAGEPPVLSRVSTRATPFIKVTSTSSPEQIARAFDDVYAKVGEVDGLVASIPFLGSGAIYVRDVAFVALASTFIKHRFGRKVRFMVVNHRGGADVVYRPTSNEDNDTTLELYPGQTFTADVLLWRD
jgi:hypothetical protein